MTAAAVGEYDYVVVGGGAAGCPLAARLSERGPLRVLLIEAGTDYPPGQEPPEILDIFAATAYADQRFIWSGLKAAYGPKPGNAPDRRRRVRYVGGPGDRRRLLDQRHGGQSRPAVRLRRLGRGGRRRLGLAGRAARSSRSSKPTATSTGRCTARTGRSACSATRRERWPGFTRGVMTGDRRRGLVQHRRPERALRRRLLSGRLQPHRHDADGRGLALSDRGGAAAPQPDGDGRNAASTSSCSTAPAAPASACADRMASARSKRAR